MPETNAPKVSSTTDDAAQAQTTAAPGEPPMSQGKQPSANTAVPTVSSQTQADVKPSAAQLGLSRSHFEEEVGQVMGSLNSWWGGVKKQSASALSSIKADLDKTVSQAQADLEYLRNAKLEIAAKPDNKGDVTPPGTLGSKSQNKEPPESENTATTAIGENQTPASHTILDRLASSTSHLQQSLQSTFQNTIASAAANPALSNPAQLRKQLAENLRLSSAKANLQLSVKQAEKMAEEYLRKGDQWMKDAEKWMGDAVKVLPPEDAQTSYIATSWDGGEFYAFTTSTASADKVLFDAERTPRTSSSTLLAASRKDILLGQLRHNEDLLSVDPEGADETPERRAEYRSWLADVWPISSEEGKAKEIGNVGDVRMTLVPEKLSDEQFWQRYLFHMHMIQAEDEKRRKLLEVTAQQSQADDFSWDDEPEESMSGPGPLLVSADVGKQAMPSTAKTSKPVQPQKDTSAATSPRDSEESYDLVSDQGGKGARKETTAPPSAATEEDDDSDWE